MNSSHDQRPPPPQTRLQALLRHPLHGLPYIRLRNDHQPVVGGPTWIKGGTAEHCKTCETRWPCRPGLALEIIHWLLFSENADTLTVRRLGVSG
jgi:hypothetical protein